jgi:hypothetical protein
MNSPAMTWRLRRIGRTLWSSIRTHNGASWIGIERARQAEHVSVSTERDRHAAAAQANMGDEPYVTSDRCNWLASLRLDRAAYAVREPA